MDIYVQCSDDMDTLARRLRERLNVAPEHPTAHRRSQKREGANLGGEYFLFEFMGLTLTLSKNAAPTATRHHSPCEQMAVEQRRRSSARGTMAGTRPGTASERLPFRSSSGSPPNSGSKSPTLSP